MHLYLVYTSGAQNFTLAGSSVNVRAIYLISPNVRCDTNTNVFLIPIATQLPEDSLVFTAFTAEVRFSIQVRYTSADQVVATSSFPTASFTTLSLMQWFDLIRQMAVRHALAGNPSAQVAMELQVFGAHPPSGSPAIALPVVIENTNATLNPNEPQVINATINLLTGKHVLAGQT